jgi:putative spermidine/putrescine transport system permease protein
MSTEALSSSTPGRVRAVARALRGGQRSIARVLTAHPRLRLGALLSLPALWLVVAYLGSLAAMFVTAFWTTDTFTGNVIPAVTTDNFQTLLQDSVYRTVALRSLGVAAAVTVVDALVALPIAFYMAKVARPRTRQIMVVAILTPLWASYLVKAYSWRVMLGENGAINWALHPFGLSGPGYGLFATVLTLSYLWLPYMILPIYAGLERVPDSLLEASSDLGASAGRTFRSIVMPLLFPAIVAGSIFTFSLSLGDYITVKIVGGATQLFANVIYDNVGTANNLPFAAAAATFPVLAMVIYLFAVRRTGALDNL